jgi:hypothetical protein
MLRLYRIVSRSRRCRQPEQEPAYMIDNRTHTGSASVWISRAADVCGPFDLRADTRFVGREHLCDLFLLV